MKLSKKWEGGGLNNKCRDRLKKSIVTVILNF